MADLSRRNFFKIAGVTTTAAAAVAAAGGTRSLLELDRGIPGRQRVNAGAPQAESWVKTTCAMCPSGCGLEVRVVDGRAVKIEGNPLHPANQGACCLKGHAALEALYSPERLSGPRIRRERGATWQEISWDGALRVVAGRLSDLRAAGQAHTVAFLHGPARGQMRGLINRFMAAYGSPNALPLESPDEQAARLAMFFSQGINAAPVYDLNNARYVLSFGGNLLESSRHVIDYLAQGAFMRRGRPERGKLVAVHPRLGLTGVKADEWVPIRPGTYAGLALGMAYVIIKGELYDRDFVRDFTFGFEDFTDAAGREHQGFKSLVLERYTLDRASAITGVPAADIARLAGEFAANRPAVAVLPVEPHGLDDGHELYTALAIHALNALVGSIDAPGGVLVQRYPGLAPLPEVAPDATAQAGLTYPSLDSLQAFEISETSTALVGPANQVARLLPDSRRLADRIVSGDPYPVNALFLYNANPVFDGSAGPHFASALAKVPFVVSFSPVLDESSVHADLLLPAPTFLETWGDDYLEGTGFAGLSLRQPVVSSVHDTRDTGDVLLQLAALLGGPTAAAHPWHDYRELVSARLVGSDVDTEKLEENGAWSELVYFNAEPGSRAWGQVVGRDRVNAAKDGHFDFYSRELAAALPALDDLACLPHFELPVEPRDAAGGADSYPLTLVSQGLITEAANWPGVLPSLQECYGLQSNTRWGSWVEIGPRAAQGLGVADGDLVWVESPAGRVRARARIYPGLWPNAVFMPAGQGHYTRTSWGRDSDPHTYVGANVNALRMANGVTRVRVYKA